MNRYLLDTHVWLWFQRGDTERFKPADRDNLLAWRQQEFIDLSPVSAWEIGLLVQAHKLDLGMSVSGS